MPLSYIFIIKVTEPLPWKSRVLARAPFEFAPRVTLRTSKILTPRFPWPRTLTNHIGVSDIGGLKALLFYRPDTARVLLVSSAGLNTCILLIGRSVIQLRAGIFSNACLVPPLELGNFHYSLPDPTAFFFFSWGAALAQEVKRVGW